MDLRGKRVFLSGPMTGIEHYDVVGFALAHAICKERGAVYIFDPTHQWFRESLEDGERKSHEDYMRSCVHELTREDFGRTHEPCAPYYDLLVLLPGWDGSDGSRHERETAVACGIAVATLSEIEKGE